MQSKSFSNEPYYSDRYYDEEYEYRHVICPEDWRSRIPKEQLMTETEWRSLGIQQSVGWEHYMIHEPEPHILLFRRRRPKIHPSAGGDSKCLY